MDAFQARLAHAGHLEPLQQAQLFTGGLPEHIRVDVKLHDPQDLHRAMGLARAYERRNACCGIVDLRLISIIAGPAVQTLDTG